MNRATEVAIGAVLTPVLGWGSVVALGRLSEYVLGEGLGDFAFIGILSVLLVAGGFATTKLLDVGTVNFCLGATLAYVVLVIVAMFTVGNTASGFFNPATILIGVVFIPFCLGAATGNTLSSNYPSGGKYTQSDRN